MQTSLLFTSENHVVLSLWGLYQNKLEYSRFHSNARSSLSTRHRATNTLERLRLVQMAFFHRKQAYWWRRQMKAPSNQKVRLDCNQEESSSNFRNMGNVQSAESASERKRQLATGVGQDFIRDYSEGQLLNLLDNVQIISHSSVFRKRKRKNVFCFDAKNKPCTILHP